MSAQIVAVLNCFSQATGANRAQLIIRADHTISFLGDENAARQALHAITGALVAGRFRLPDPPASGVPFSKPSPS